MKVIFLNLKKLYIQQKVGVGAAEIVVNCFTAIPVRIVTGAITTNERNAR